MAQNDNSIPYLVALRNSAAAGAQSPATESSQGTADFQSSAKMESDPSYSGPEKRRSSRYKCDGGIEMREEGCDVPTWARFTDISLHGCYVEAQATYPPGTILHLKMEADGISIDTKGDVRVSYPYLGMGIAFVEMSEENRVRLKQLLGVVSRGSSPDAATFVPQRPRLREPVPSIADPSVALHAVIQFFESHTMLSRAEFRQVIQASQSGAGTQQLPDTKSDPKPS